MLEQLALSELEGLDRQIAEYIIGNLDEAGYLKREVDSIASDLTIFQGLNVSPEPSGAGLASYPKLMIRLV